MSYKIYLDNNLIHSTNSVGNKVINPILELELNTVGTLKFQIDPTNEYYDSIRKMASVIDVYRDNNWLWSGRVLNTDKDFNNIKSVECEGELAYLLDSNQRLEEFHDISVRDYFTALITNHNAMVENNKKFVVGNVTVTDPNDSLYRFNNYQNTWDALQDKLVSRLGGYIRTRHESGIKYIDYIAEYGNTNTQVINFGKNILDLTETIKGDEIATAIIPLGAKLNEEGSGTETEQNERLTIKDVNGGLDYIYDQEAVDNFGWIFKVVEFDDVTVAENLKTKGYKELNKYKGLVQTIELNALDLSNIDISIEQIKLGDLIQVKSKPHDLNAFMLISKMSIDIVNPGNNTITLGKTISSITKENSKNKADVIIEKINENYVTNEKLTNTTQVINERIQENSSSITQLPGLIMSSIENKFLTNEDFESYKSTVMTQTDDQIEFKFTTVDGNISDVRNMVNNNQMLLEEYIRFRGAILELGRIGNEFTAELSNERLQFKQNGEAIAYISNNKLYITDAEIKNKMTIGNTTNGFFDFVPRDNGNLSLKWRAK